MKFIIILLGIVFILSGISLLFNAEYLYDFIEDNIEESWLYIGAIIGRLVIGVLLIRSANQSKFPTAIKFFGYVAVIAAIIFILIGHDGFQNLVSSIIPAFKPYGRMTGLIIMVFGGLLIYAFLGKKEL